MHSRQRLSIATVAVLLGTVVAAQADEEKTPKAKAPKPLTAKEVVEKANRVAYYQGRDGSARVSMTITDAQGRQRTRSFTMLRKDEQPADDKTDKICGDQKFYVFFHRPADVNKTAFLIWKHLDRDDDRWMYLPALDLVNRIAASDKRSSFVGSHFFYEDVSGRSIKADEHKLVRTTANYYVLTGTPLKPKTVEFAYYKVWIHRKTFISVKMEFFDKQGQKYRVYEALHVEVIDGYPTVTRSRMKDLRTKGETVITYSRIKYNIGLPQRIFTERNLRNPLKKHLR